MSDNNTVAVVRDSLAAAKDSLAGVHMDTPVDSIARNGQARRRWHTLTGVTGAVAVMAGAALGVATLAPSGHAGSSSGRGAGHAERSLAGQVTGNHDQRTPTARLAAWTVARQANGDIQVSVRELTDLPELQSTLRADGVPANVSLPGHADPSCRPYPMSKALFTSVYRADKTAASGDTVLIIDPFALPRGTGVQIAAAVGGHAAGRGLGQADVKSIHQVVHQPGQRASADNVVLRAVLVYASQRCTGT